MASLAMNSLEKKKNKKKKKETKSKGLEKFIDEQLPDEAWQKLKMELQWIN